MSLLVASSHVARDLARLLAGWLVAIVAVQAMASAIGLVQGPRHTHLGGGPVMHASVSPTPLHDDDHDHPHGDGHDHHHDAWSRHVHDASTPGLVLHDDAQDLGAAAGVVLAAMVAIGLALGPRPSAGARHVMRAGIAWSCRPSWVSPALRPPQA